MGNAERSEVIEDYDDQNEFPEGDDQEQEEELQGQSEEGVEDTEEEVEAHAEPEDPEREQYVARTRKRMNDLLRDRKKERDLRKKRERELDEMRERIAKMEQEKDELHQKVVKSSSESLRTQLRKAIEEGDEEKQADLLAELAQVHGRPQYTERKAQEPDREQQDGQQSQADESPATKWVQRNQHWFAGEPEKLKLAQKLETELEQEGYSREDDDLYEELDHRLEERQKLASKKPAQRTTAQSVQTGSRRDTAPPRQGGKRGNFTREDRVLMGRFGLDADNPAHREQWLQSKSEM